MTPIPPSANRISEARRLAEELLEIATGGGADCWRSWDVKAPELSQSDRLVIVAGRLGRISELLRCEWIDEPEAAE